MDNDHDDQTTPVLVPDMELNRMIISLWINESDKGSDEVWYIGFVTDTCDDSQDEVIVDHLHPKDKSLARWRYPPKSDECRVDRRQIIISVRP